MPRPKGQVALCACSCHVTAVPAGTTEGGRWTVVDPPRYSWMREHDCTICGHESLKKPVWLSRDNGSAQPCGTGCAAKLTGKSQGTFTKQRDEHLAKAKDEATRSEARTERYRKALADYEREGSAIVQRGPHPNHTGATLTTFD